MSEQEPAAEAKPQTLEGIQKEYAHVCGILGDKTYKYELDKGNLLNHLVKLNEQANALKDKDKADVKPIQAVQ